MKNPVRKLPEPMFCEKGTTVNLEIAKGVTNRFKVKKSFKVHGYGEHKIIVTIPATLETLRGLGFISKVK